MHGRIRENLKCITKFLVTGQPTKERRIIRLFNLGKLRSNPIVPPTPGSVSQPTSDPVSLPGQSSSASTALPTSPTTLSVTTAGPLVRGRRQDPFEDHMKGMYCTNPLGYLSYCSGINLDKEGK